MTFKVPFLSDAQLESAAQELLRRYAKWKGDPPRPPIPVDAIAESVLGLTLRHRLGQLASAPEGDRSMKIVMRDGRVFQGTALQIVKAMQDIAFGVEDFTVPKYIEWVVANARKFEEVELDVKGETDEELAASLVAEMLRAGLTRRM